MADSIDRVASAVADGLPIDWVREKARRPEHIELYDQLQALSRIGQVYESANPSDTTRVLEAQAPDEPEPRTPLFRWGSLEVLEKIGEGSGGEVYRAHDPTLRADVALKLLRPDYSSSPNLTRRFLDEARRLARVRHPNVLMVYGADTHDGRVGLWTELITGCSLEDLITQQGRMSACEAAVLGLDLCRALAAVHAAGLIHRDVKTTNVMREEGGRIVLMDFGSVAESPLSIGQAWSSGFQGTPICMAPEQLRGEVAGAATDVYGLGVLLYRLVTKRYPIEASSLSELREMHRAHQQIPLRDRRADLPLEFVQFVDRTLRPNSDERYATVGAMELELALVLGAMARREVGRRRVRVVFISTVAVLAVVVGIGIGASQFGTWGSPQAQRRGAAPPARVRLTAEATLMRRVGSLEEPIANDAKIRLGDHLSLLVRSSDSMYVYVLNQDAGGEVNNLYPVPGLLPANPLQPHMRHRLPGDLGADVIYWTVSSAGGRESIVAIGSRTPLLELESAIAEMPRAVPGEPIQFGRLDVMRLRSLRGLGSGAALPPPAGESKERLEAAVEALREVGEKTGDVWVWSITLENP